MKTLRPVAICALAILLFAGIVPIAAHAQTFQSLYSFTGTPDGAEPFQSNLLLVNGALLGTTGSGGTFNAGTIFKYTAMGDESVLYSFTGGSDGYQPSSGLIKDSKGNLYGTTFYGGDASCVLSSTASGCGTVYKLDTTGNLSVLYTFQGGTDGALPQGLVMDAAGNLYGAAFYGGNLNCPLFPGVGCGVVFKISAGTNAFSALYTFQGGTDGGIPEGFLTLHGTAVYGATQIGGLTADCGGAGCGVVFAVSTSSGAEKPIYSFTGGTDGGSPLSQLLFDKNGNVYGTTYAGGNSACTNNGSVGCGVIFRLSSTGTETVLHTFQGSPNDAANPTWGLTAGASGNLYGTTVYGGSNNLGTIFEFSSKGVESVLHGFTGTDGEYPQSGLVYLGKTGLYSNAGLGGDLSCNSPNGCGTLFRIVP